MHLPDRRVGIEHQIRFGWPFTKKAKPKAKPAEARPKTGADQTELERQLHTDK
jgi:hypothetical protein